MIELRSAALWRPCRTGPANDHAGGLRLFDPGVAVYVQRTELHYGLSGHPFPEQHGHVPHRLRRPADQLAAARRRREPRPGVDAVFRPGHTPGHQSFLVRLADGGGYAFTFDGADLTENIELERGPGGFVHCGAQEALDSPLCLKAIAAERGLPLVTGHDPVAWPALTAALA